MAPFHTASHGKAPFLVLEKPFVYFPTLLNIKAPHYINFFGKKKKRKIISQTCFRYQHDSFVILLQQIFQSLLVVSRKNEVGFLEQKIHLILADCCK